MRTGLFVDVSNLYPSIKSKYSGRIDYGRLISALDNPCRAFAYGSQVGNEAFNFIIALKHLSYTTRFKKLRLGETWNIDLTCDVFSIIDKIDAVLIGSNSIELIPLYDYLRNRGIFVYIYACDNEEILTPHCDMYKRIIEDDLEK